MTEIAFSTTRRTLLAGLGAAVLLRDAIGHGTIRVLLARELRLCHNRALGLSNAKIARKLGMTETGVSKIVARGAGADRKPRLR